MADPTDGNDSAADIDAAFRALIAGMSVDEMKDTLARVTRYATDRRNPLTPGPSRRRPRRAHAVTLQVRVDIVDASPPLWRRLELASDMQLDEVHAVLQIAFGWTDSHLHRFAVGGSVYDPASELFLCPFDVEEGEDEGVPESDVRLDELLVEPGDELTYVYDYGDDWELRLRLEAVLDRSDAAPRARATGGRRLPPPDDSGGIYAYDEMVRDLADGEVDELDLDALDDDLATGAVYARILQDLPVELRLLVARCMGDPVHDTLLELVLEAGLATPAVPTEGLAAEMTERYRWLVDRIGPAGVKLTSAGYLPPAVVAEAYEHLGLQDEWIGKGNREDLTIPVLVLRTSAVKLGLLRKSRGVLLATKTGSAVAAEPLALWWHVARRLPLEAEDSVDRIVALIRILGLAAGRDVSSNRFRALAADVLTAVGWRADSRPLTPQSMYAFDLASDDVLSHLLAFDRSRRYARGAPSQNGTILARAILQHLASRR